jgi:hypothetical protein
MYINLCQLAAECLRWRGVGRPLERGKGLADAMGGYGRIQELVLEGAETPSSA